MAKTKYKAGVGGGKGVNERQNLPNLHKSNKPITEKRGSIVERANPRLTQPVTSQFKKHFQKLDRSSRHDLVEKVMQKKFGSTDWRKAVYGKNYKSGTVKGLNKDIKQARSQTRNVTSTLKQARSNLAKASGNESNKSKIEARLNELKKTQAENKTTLEHKKEKRQSYLDRRNKSLESIQKTSKKNPAALAAGRKRLAEKKIDEVKKSSEKKKKKGKSKSTQTGGTEAP